MFQIDSMSRVPIYEQIIDQLEKFILTGTITPGEQIPSVRSVSVQLSINPVTILKAYSDLDARGLIHSVPGKGYFVSDGAKEALSKNKLSILGDIHRLASELSLAGIPLEAVIDEVKSAYDKASEPISDERK